MTTSPTSATPAITNAATVQPPRSIRSRLLLIAGSIAVYALACALPASRLSDAGEITVHYGYELALLGWLAVFIFQFGWIANLFWLVSLLFELFRLHIVAAITAGVGLLVALHTFALFGQDIPIDESGVNFGRLQQLDAGFYVWLLSMVVVVVGAFVLRARDQKAT